MMNFNLASVGATGRYKERTKRKDKALSNITFGANFQDLPAEGLCALAQWGTEYKAGYKATVCAGLDLMPEDLKEEVIEYMNEETVDIQGSMSTFGEDDYFPSKGKWKSNQFLHRASKQATQRHAGGWIRKSDSGEMWGDCHSEENDDYLFAPDTRADAAVLVLNNGSLTGVVSNYTGTAKFPKNLPADMSCPPDEQRYRAFLYAVTKATGKYRQVAQIRNMMAGFKRGNQTLQAVAQKVKRMVEIGDIANILIVMKWAKRSRWTWR
jgi:hypothetical protein